MAGLCWAVLCITCFCATQKGTGMLYLSDPFEITQSEKETEKDVLPITPFITPLLLIKMAQCNRLAALAASLIGPINEPATSLPHQDTGGGAGKVNKSTVDELMAKIRLPFYNATVGAGGVISMDQTSLELNHSLLDSNTLQKVEEERKQLIQKQQQVRLRAQRLRESQQRSSADHASNKQGTTNFNKNDLKPVVLTPRPMPKKNATQIVAICLCIMGIVGLGCLLILVKKIRSRQKVAVLYAVMFLFPAQGWAQEKKPVEIQKGPSSGIIVQEAPGLILTERRLVSQLIFVDLDPELAIAKYRKHTLVMGPDLTAWYMTHISRTKASVRNILDQLVRTFIAKDDIQTPKPKINGRQKRFAGVIVGIIALSVVGVVIGSVMSSVNAMTIKKVAEQTQLLKSSLVEIQSYLKSQSELTDEIILVVNSTVVIQNQNSLKIVHAAKAIERLDTARRNLVDFIDPLTFATQEYLREFQNSISCLIRGQIPLYLITNKQVKALLSRLHHLEIDDLQIRVALEMGSAITMYIDPEKLQLSFLVQLPLVMADRVYQTKQVFNTGIWRGDTYMKIKAPEYLAYQNWSDNTILVPRLETCVKFKDIHHLCPGKPFLPDPSGALCGIQTEKGNNQVCDMVISKPTVSELNTVVALVQDRWLVSSRLENITVSYALHGTFRVIPLPYRVSLINVPKDTMVMIGDRTIFHIPSQVMDGKIQLINAFPEHEMTLDSDIEYLINNKAEHTVQLAISPESIKIRRPQFSSLDFAMLNNRDDMQIQMIMILVVLSLLSLWILMNTIMTCRNTKHRKKTDSLNAFRKAMTQAADYTPIFKGRLEMLQDGDLGPVTPV